MNFGPVDINAVNLKLGGSLGGSWIRFRFNITNSNLEFWLGGLAHDRQYKKQMVVIYYFIRNLYVS